MRDENPVDRVDGDGMPETTEPERLATIKESLREIISDSEAEVWERRIHAEETKFCLWPNQTLDGKKHDTENARAFPFPGASDARIRTADEIVNDRVKILTMAATRFTPQAVGVESNDNRYAAKMTALIRWVIRNQLRGEWRREIKRVANWQESDSPGIAVMGTFWHQEPVLEIKTVTVKDLIDVLMQIGQERGLADEDLASQLEAFYNSLNAPEMDQENATLLQLLIPSLKPARARKMVLELRTAGQASFPMPRLKSGRPMVCAFRLFDDIWFPSYVGDIQRSPVIVTREWLIPTEIKGRQFTHNWDSKFIEECLTHAGESFQPDYYRTLVNGEYGVGRGQQERKGQIEILTAYYRACNDDEIPGIYMMQFHSAVDTPAAPEQLLPYSHGKYPFTVFASETISGRYWDARGVPERVSTDQNAEKLLHDSSQDRTQLSTVPPIRVPTNRPRNMRLLIKPLAEIPGKVGDYEWMKPPVNDGSNDNQQAAIKARIDSYWARPSAGVDPVRVQIAQEDLTADFLDSLTEVVRQIGELCQQYMTDADLTRVLNDQRLPMIRSTEEIQGGFDITLSFDPRDMDLKYLKEKIGVIKEAVALDVNATIRRDKLVAWIFRDMDPWMAEEIVENMESTTQREIDDEQGNFAKIAAGVEPRMLENGQNFGLRLKWIQQQVNMNPDSVRMMPPMSQEILKKRIDHLQFMVQQHEQNPMIGRLGAMPAMEGEI